MLENSLVIVSSILITLALVFYSLGVWSERIAQYLKPWHMAAFWTGYVFDVSGRHCQLELILALLDVSFRQKTTVYGAFLA